ncbi:rhotekin isoform X3 [Ixodes scapularis]|uniref:rhotekin isoform X3 n=1 Tax=Ixodes scapularis TaxID=6945 RepID=UPI001161727F|nr:rhotekin isoform X3 [Ixodes scapularis]
MDSCLGARGLFGHSSSSDAAFGSRQLEVIQDLDLYFIRQIARGLGEYNLEQKIDLEIKMREGTTKLLAVCQHRPQSLEAAKSLLTSNERMSAYMTELQRRKTSDCPTFNESTGSPSVEPSNARVAVSDIRMPLIWKDTDHFKNKGDYRSNNIPAGFEFRMEVYSHVLQDDLSMASTPRKIKTKITNSVSKAIGKKLASSLREELNSWEIGPKFVLEAHATLGLADADDRVRTHDLVVENVENPQQQLPLFGHLGCKLAVVPDCVHEERLSGYLSVVQTPSGAGSCGRLWCILKNFQLCLWRSEEDSRHLPPMLSIPITKDTRLRPEEGASKQALRILTNASEKGHLLMADSEPEHTKWLAHLWQHVKDHELWGDLASKRMEIPSPGPRRAPTFGRQTSLYDETSLRESPQGAVSRTGDEGIQRISPTSARSRSSSTSSASSSVSAARAFPLAKKGFGHF